MIEINQITTIFLAVALFAFGSFLINKINFLKRFCIPAPVVGGLLFAALATILKTTGLLEISLDTSLQSLFMITFSRQLV